MGDRATVLTAAFAPPLSLADQDCFAIAAALRTLPGGWLAQRDEDDEGIVTMSLIPVVDEGDDPLFVIRREADGIVVEAGNSGAWLGRYASLPDAMAAIRQTLPD